ncbi:phosphate ABC transporter permease PstA [Litoribacillus peritrichatus]|uniref:Phosphate transport system permease protein PstA n=1 Tax=Litoribacillus peritrichatus TaxID=718191 RepID=A0ABP7MEX6_9GAMM
MLSSRQTDQFMTGLIWLVAIVVTVIPLMMAYDLLANGIQHISWSFLVDKPLDSGRSGGIGPLIVSTFLILFVCLSVVFPFGLACALYLSEMVEGDSTKGKQISQALDILSGVPSIVFGLFGYVFFAQILGLGFSILSGGLTLACMALPLFVRLTEQALRHTPNSYRQAAEALNLSHVSFVFRILLPSASTGIAAATIVATGRALAETAVLIFTAGYVMRQPESLMDSGRALSVHIYDLAMNVAGGTKPAAATALVLLSLLILINLFARFLSKRWLRQ